MVLHSLNSGKDILPAQGSLQISKEEDSGLQMTNTMNKQVKAKGSLKGSIPPARSGKTAWRRCRRVGCAVAMTGRAFR